jgi:hypothetical protein
MRGKWWHTAVFISMVYTTFGYIECFPVDTNILIN